MSFKITDKVQWVGKIDWELRRFHGDEYSTNKGSSYNSYLIRDEKTVLIDTIWAPYDKEFVDNLKKEIDLDEIDYIIAQHAEVDHSGALPLLLKEIPDTPVYCTKNGKRILQGHYHEDWNFVEVKTGDTLDIGESTLTFVEARMLHWPDSMMTYMSGENILFSNDAFGQHYASEFFYNDKVDQCELWEEAIKYYANILTPFSKLVTMKINEILGFELPLSMIATSHGIIWRDNPAQIVEKYLEWADDYQENQISIIYDSMWHGTRRMAEGIMEGIRKTDPDVTVKLFNAAITDKNDIITEIFRSKGILLGSSTVNKSIQHAVGGLMEMVKGLGFQKKKAAAFGSYGWSGESIGILEGKLKEANFEVVQEGIKSLWNPDDEAMEECKDFGKRFAESFK
ncbi:anaerobic nitric oxide reductase flavorubredoxin [Gudongella sp. DL1XJH-153]|uniref:anaerobic nitric oxide reductase flavorubredoxin n=1 Tax=Gudongella sp. DL1XJH-153 TaxID=3409804 RepID=UPI003BB51307